MKKIIALGFVLLFISKNIVAQNTDSTKVVIDTLSKTAALIKDSTKALDVKKRWIPVPKKALLYSIIPGGGQVYNRKLWYIKVPIVLGAMGFGVERIITNGRIYRQLREIYKKKIVDDPNIDYGDLIRLKGADATFILNNRNAFDKNFQQSYALTAIIYILSGVEAFTAAHLMNFDISDDISLHLKPSFDGGTPSGSTVGLGIQLSFH